MTASVKANMKTNATSNMFAAIVEAPFGAIGVRTQAGALHELVYLPPSYDEQAARDACAEAVVRELNAYLDNPDHRFSLDVPVVGTEFQRRVWACIREIPRGSVLTYGDIARQLRSAPRAVGQACGANWFPVIIPCHRVTAAGGLGGFAHHDDDTGFHLGVKRWLLRHEGVSIT